MKKYDVSCIDNKTKKTMVFSDVFYNSACFWLENHVGIPKRIYEDKDYTVFEYNNINYYFDDDRSILLKD